MIVLLGFLEVFKKNKRFSRDVLHFSSLRFPGAPRGASASYKKSIFFHEKKGSPFLALLGSSSDAPRAPKSALGASSGRPQGSKVRDVSCEMHVFKKATGTSLELLFERRRSHKELPDHFRDPLRDPKWQPWVQN